MGVGVCRCACLCLSVCLGVSVMGLVLSCLFDAWRLMVPWFNSNISDFEAKIWEKDKLIAQVKSSVETVQGFCSCTRACVSVCVCVCVPSFHVCLCVLGWVLLGSHCALHFPVRMTASRVFGSHGGRGGATAIQVSRTTTNKASNEERVFMQMCRHGQMKGP